jgi:magnesium-transporting ATPase (P-type)
MTDDFRRDFDNAYTSYGERGRRLIGFAIYHTEALPTKKWNVEDVPLGKLSFLGMVAIMDPPRDDAAIAIAQCKVDMPLGVRGHSP